MSFGLVLNITIWIANLLAFFTSSISFSMVNKSLFEENVWILDVG